MLEWLLKLIQDNGLLAVSNVCLVIALVKLYKDGQTKDKRIQDIEDAQVKDLRKFITALTDIKLILKNGNGEHHEENKK